MNALLRALPVDELARAVADMSGIAHAAHQGVELFAACVFRRQSSGLLEIHAVRLMTPLEAVESYVPTLIQSVRSGDDRRVFWMPMELTAMDEPDLAVAVTLPRQVWLLPPGVTVDTPTAEDAGKYRECDEAEFGVLRRVYDRAPKEVHAALR